MGLSWVRWRLAGVLRFVDRLLSRQRDAGAPRFTPGRRPTFQRTGAGVRCDYFE